MLTVTNNLELLRTALSLDHTLFTIQRNISRPDANIRIDCFASKGAESPGLTRITDLVACVLKCRRSLLGLILDNGGEVDRNLVTTLSKKLELDLKHERVNGGIRSTRNFCQWQCIE